MIDPMCVFCGDYCTTEEMRRDEVALGHSGATAHVRCLERVKALQGKGCCFCQVAFAVPEDDGDVPVKNEDGDWFHRRCEPLARSIKGVESETAHSILRERLIEIVDRLLSRVRCEAYGLGTDCADGGLNEVMLFCGDDCGGQHESRTFLLCDTHVEDVEAILDKRKTFDEVFPRVEGAT